MVICITKDQLFRQNVCENSPWGSQNNINGDPQEIHILTINFSSVILGTYSLKSKDNKKKDEEL